MSPDPSIPRLRDLPAARLEIHHAHLLTEISRKRSWRRPSIRWTSLRVGAVAGAGVVAAAAIALAVTWGSGNHTTPRDVTVSPPLAYSFHVSPPRPVGDQEDYLPAPARAWALTGDVGHRGRRVPIVVYVLARQQAELNGDGHPAALQWVKTTRQLAVSSQSSDRVDSPGRPVYFVVLHGHFVDTNAYYLGVGPKGSAANAPKGTVLSFTIDRESGTILDFALGNTSPDYRRIGRPHRFTFARRRRTK